MLLPLGLDEMIGGGLARCPSGIRTDGRIRTMGGGEGSLKEVSVSCLLVLVFVSCVSYVSCLSLLSLLLCFVFCVLMFCLFFPSFSRGLLGGKATFSE